MKKIIVILSIVTMLFSCFAIGASATNRGDQSAMEEEQGIAFYELGVVYEPEIGQDIYSVPTTALVHTYGQTINNNIAGGGTLQIRASQRVTQPRNDLRHWRTEIQRQFTQDDPQAQAVTFRVADFIYNIERYEALQGYWPTIKGNGFVYNEIKVTTIFDITGYIDGRWETLRINKTTTTAGESAFLFPHEAINTATENRFFNDECLISNMYIIVEFYGYNYNTDRVEKATIGNFEYTTYTDVEQETVSYFLTKYNRPNAPSEELSTWEWLKTSVDSMLDLRIYGDFSIKTILYAVMGVAIVLIFFKVFAGG